MAMSHPNIIALHASFEDTDSVYLLLEYANGGSLYNMMQRHGRLIEKQAAKIFVDTAKAVMHLHAKGIIHRDVKPENVLLCEGSSVAKLADFGWCAEMPKDGAERYTFCGTWDYLAPEMLHNEPHGAPVDVWTLGILLFEMLVGKPPFAEVKRVEALRRITIVEFSYPADITASARDLISQMLVRAPEQRLPLQKAICHKWVLELSERGTPSSGQLGRRSRGVEPQLPAHLRALSRERLNKLELDSPRLSNRVEILPEPRDGQYGGCSIGSSVGTSLGSGSQ
eukprot:5505795-Amphidinium_carterae.1